MKSPQQISERLAKQWLDGNLREQRLLSTNAWPIRLSIGTPSPQTFLDQTAELRTHIEQWRKVSVGEVIWEEKKYQSSAESVALPKLWQISRPSDWVEATGDKSIKQEFVLLEKIVANIDSVFHRIVVRKRHLIMAKPVDEVILASNIALNLQPGCAHGKPLRALSILNCDSKFFERHRSLIVQLLDVLFDNAVSDTGLETFLNALDESDHWLLVAPLDTQLLPFKQCRVRSSELEKSALPASHIIIVENEHCLHQLPQLPDTIAVLGAGLNLSWLNAAWLKPKTLAYWGDMDTWGLLMLARAKIKQSHINAILMNQTLFDEYSHTFAVAEAQNAELAPPIGLSAEECKFYDYLYSLDKGRLEQEFLPNELVVDVFTQWRNCR